MEKRFYKGINRYEKGDWCIGIAIEMDKGWGEKFQISIDLFKIRLYFGYDTSNNEEDILY